MLQRQPLFDKILTVDVLMWAAIIVFTSIILIYFCPYFEKREKILLAGLFLAVAGWLFTSAITIRNRIKQHSLDLILRTRFDEVYKNSMLNIRTCFSGMTVISEEQAKNIFYAADEEGKKLRSSIVDILNYHEYLALAIWFKDADEIILKEYYKDIILWHYEKLKNVIPLWRQDEKDAFEYYEWLYNRWKIKLAP